jgi:hypothetical protein
VSEARKDEPIRQGALHLMMGAANTPSSDVKVAVRIGRNGHVHIEVLGRG